MRILKVLLYGLLALVGIGIILGLAGPKTYKVERSAVITASPDAIWPHVSSIRSQNTWSPFTEQDTAMVVEYTGTDGEVGSGSKWASKKMGKGEQTITSVDPNKGVTTRLKFIMPWGASESDAYLNMEPDVAGTKVTWGFGGQNDFMGRIFGSIMSMEKAVGPMYEKGLINLQTLVASAPPPAMGKKYAIKEGQYQGGTYLTIRGSINMTEMESFYGKNFQTIMGEIQKTKITPATMPLGMYYTWDMEKGMTDMAAAIGVPADTKEPAGLTKVTLPANKSLTMMYTGGYHGLGNAHAGFEDYIKTNNLTQLSPVVEEYITDPGSEPDSNKYVTQITYFVK